MQAFLTPNNTPVWERSLLVVRLRNGVGNRIHALAASLVVAQLLHARLEIVWEIDEHCKARFEQLFERSGFENVVFSCNLRTGEQWIDAATISGKEIAEVLRSRRIVLISAYSYFAFDLAPHANLRQLFTTRLRSFRPVSEVCRLIASIPPCRVGIHIRTTDHLPSQIMTPLWCYNSAMREVSKTSPDEVVFLCADSSRVLEQMSDRWKARVTYLPPLARRPSLDRDSLESIRHALADLWILSSCSAIVAGHWSTFARAAVAFGFAQPMQLDGPPVFLSFPSVGEHSWKLYRWVMYDMKSEKWIIRPEIKGYLQKGISKIVLLLVRAIRSDLYQKSGDPLMKLIVMKRLKAFLGRIFAGDGAS